MASHPLPLTQAESLQLDTVLAVLAAIFVLIPFCYLSGGCRVASYLTLLRLMIMLTAMSMTQPLLLTPLVRLSQGNRRCLGHELCCALFALLYPASKLERV